MGYSIGDMVLDALDLKALVLTHGVRVSSQVYAHFGPVARLSKNPIECNCMILPDGTIAQLTDVGFHMEYVKSVMAWDVISKVKSMSLLRTPLTLELGDAQDAVLRYEGRDVTTVGFPPATSFYRQKTSSDLPFVGNAVLQGRQWLSFQLLWKCDYAWAGRPCQYCYSGGELQSLAKRGKSPPRYPSAIDVAEIVAFAVMTEHCADSIQITGGSTFDVQREYAHIEEILRAIDVKVGRDNIGGEILIYVTAPEDPNLVDRLFETGADRVSISLEIWDESLAAKIMPGKMRYTGRESHLRALEHVARTHGPNKACSNFIVGLEPVESMLRGAEYLATRGIVPIASVWIPFGRPVLGSMRAPSLDYYRRAKAGLARIYEKYGIVPPGGSGLNVCMCRDIYLQRETILR